MLELFSAMYTLTMVLLYLSYVISHLSYRREKLTFNSHNNEQLQYLPFCFTGGLVKSYAASLSFIAAKRTTVGHFFSDLCQFLNNLLNLSTIVGIEHGVHETRDHLGTNRRMVCSEHLIP